MNNLTCKVKECTNNCSGLCQLGRIKVNGSEPMSSSGTYCASFAEKKGSVSNSSACGGNASPETKIECRVHNCAYNEGNLCSASKVNMGCSSSSPKIMDETECETFKHR